MTTDKTRAAALSQGLRAMFKRLEARPAPDRLRLVLEQLDEADATPAGRGKVA